MAGLLSPSPALDAVAAELRHWASEPFDWRRTNCGLSVLAYIERRTGRSLEPRPSFESKSAALRHVLACGGMEAMCADAMARLRCAATRSPRRGDVGLVRLTNGLTAAICAGRIDLRIGTPAPRASGLASVWVWAARGDRAVVIEQAEPLAAWSVQCPRP